MRFFLFKILVFAQIKCVYYNFHAIAKRLINDGHTLSASIFDAYHHISPALVIYFDNHKPIPIRQYMWDFYIPLLKDKNIIINNMQS